MPLFPKVDIVELSCQDATEELHVGCTFPLIPPPFSVFLPADRFSDIFYI